MHLWPIRPLTATLEPGGGTRTSQEEPDQEEVGTAKAPKALQRHLEPVGPYMRLESTRPKPLRP
jgi:hypothetical protein